MISLRALAAGYLVAVAPFYLAFVTAYYPQYTSIPVAKLFPPTSNAVPEKLPVVEPMVFQPLRSIAPQERNPAAANPQAAPTPF
jgi:hypothetical protein